MIPPAFSTLTTSDGLRLAYDDAGSGPPVVLVHGLGLSRRRWQRQKDMLVAAGRRAISLDLRGFGDSELPDQAYTMATLVADLAALTAALALPAFDLVGHSLGGMVAQRFAIAHPGALRSLTLAATTSHNGARASAFGRAIAELSRRGFDAAAADLALRGELEAVLAVAFPAGPPPLEMFRRGLEAPNPAQAYGWTTTIDFSTKDELGAITCPVLVVHGTSDQVIPFTMGRLIHQAIPGSRFVPLPGAGHLLPVERADELNGALSDFLSCGKETRCETM